MDQPAQKVFYAYPSRPPHVSETIHGLAQQVDESGGGLAVVTWTSLQNSGRILWDPIDAQIRNCDAFCCDLTYLNNNVLFELGFAIALGKPIFISLNSSISGATNNYARFRLLENIGYSAYTNQHDLYSKFFQESPWSRAAATSASPTSSRTVFYAKLPTPTDASNEVDSVVSRLNQSSAEIRVDDQQENPFQSLQWYKEQISSSAAVVIHRLGDQQKGPEDHNYRCALLAGMACGYGLSDLTLVLSQEPAVVPLDLKDMFKTYPTAKMAGDLARLWMSKVTEAVHESSSKKVKRRSRKRSAQKLRGLTFGQNMAENERNEITEYLIETGPFQSALDGRALLFVGRKGTGKSANVIAIEERLRDEHGVLVCPIKPLGYMLDRLIETLQGVQTIAEEGFLIGSIWKYLIFTELALAVRFDVRNRSPQLIVTEEEQELLRFIEQNGNFFGEDFGQRLNYGIQVIKASHEAEGTTGGRLKVSEALHSQLLARLRDLLKEALSDRKRVAILVDNLDKNWKHSSDTSLLVEFLRGLVDVAERIQEELDTRPFGERGPNYTISIFLRSDIYATFRETSGERDKVNGEILDWHDQEQLGRLLDERLEYFADVDDPSKTWSDYFDDVEDSSARTYILHRVLPRPRDAIFLGNSALDKAKNRGHTEVTNADLIEAFKSYSNWAFDSLLAEDHPVHRRLESVVFEFIGSKSTVSQSEVSNALKRAKVPLDLQLYYRDLLLDTNFLGLIGQNGEIIYPADEEGRRRSLRIQQKYHELRESEPSFMIHPAFYPALGIDDC